MSEKYHGFPDPGELHTKVAVLFFSLKEAWETEKRKAAEAGKEKTKGKAKKKNKKPDHWKVALKDIYNKYAHIEKFKILYPSQHHFNSEMATIGAEKRKRKKQQAEQREIIILAAKAEKRHGEPVIIDKNGQFELFKT